MSQSRVKAEVIVNRPIEEVFAFVVDMNNHAEWQPPPWLEQDCFSRFAPSQ